ncbi:hypothetical protein GGI43DRAFT_323256 [Trichoderma evansii]
MSNRVPPPPLDLSAASGWTNEVPDDYARKIEPVSPNRRKSRKGVTAEALIEWNQQISPIAVTEAVLEAASDVESNLISPAAKTPEIKNETGTPVHSDVFMISEQSPRIEANDTSPCVSDFGIEAAVSGEQRTAFEELSGANFLDGSDSESERNAFIHGNDTESDAVYVSKSIASDSVGDFTGDSACDIANHMAEPITGSNIGQYQNQEPNITHEDCQECINMKEELAQERVRREEQTAQKYIQMEEQMVQQRRDMEEKLVKERKQMEEKLVSLEKEIAEFEARSIAFEHKAVAYVDACMDTETHNGQEAGMSSPILPPSPPQLGSSSATPHLTQTPLDQVFGACLALFYECQSLSPTEIPYLFIGLIKSIFFRRVTPLCCLGNLFLLLQTHREREMWMQANSLTRKHLLEHPGAQSSVWELLVIIGSFAVIS